MSIRILPLLVLLVALSCFGCGDDHPHRFPVSGQVLIDGKPVEHGTIQVIPEGDRAASGKLGPDGRFQLTTFKPNDGCVPGKHKVKIVATESPDPQSQLWHAPKKYTNPDESRLTVDITEPTDSLTIELTWDGGEPFVERFNAE